MSEPIVRIAARGDGVTASGRHAPLAAPGDLLRDDGSVEPGVSHQQPPCRHFPRCGGCQLQHVDDLAYRQYLADRISGALAQHGIGCEIRPPHLSPPRSRRRASLRALLSRRQVEIGFNAARSHRVVDMRECHILHPQLFELVAPLRQMLAVLSGQRRSAEIRLTLCDQGVDLLLSGLAADGLDAAEALTAFAERNGLARLAIDSGLGAEVRYQPEVPTVTLGGIAVELPPAAFLQATADGEAALLDGVREAVGHSGRTADLFAGLGTFALALGGRVHAAEGSRDAAAALASAAARAGRPLRVEHRDLYRRPLDAAELAAFEAVVLDPPRAGAAEQVAELGRSGVARIAYVSCNPATFARDAAMLVAGGYRLPWAMPVGQFRWSTHVELVAAFER